MSQRDQLLVFAGIVLSNDRDWMPMRLLLLHNCAHVHWHVTFRHKESNSLEVHRDRYVPHRYLTKRLVILTFLDSCNVVVHSYIVLVGF